MSLLLDGLLDVCASQVSVLWPTLASTQLSAEDRKMGKAMSAAYKAAMLQAFCIPVAGTEDADASTSRLVTRPSVQTGQPVEGWEQWASDVMDTLGICESIAAVDRVQSGKRPQLRAIVPLRWGPPCRGGVIG